MAKSLEFRKISESIAREKDSILKEFDGAMLEHCKNWLDAFREIATNSKAMQYLAALGHGRDIEFLGKEDKFIQIVRDTPRTKTIENLVYDYMFDIYTIKDIKSLYVFFDNCLFGRVASAGQYEKLTPEILRAYATGGKVPGSGYTGFDPFYVAYLPSMTDSIEKTKNAYDEILRVDAEALKNASKYVSQMKKVLIQVAEGIKEGSYLLRGI